MSVILYINGEQVELEPNNVIAQTKQINDINSIANRQANYTNRFKVPMTANNMRIMKQLSFPGNKSNVPYQKNECSLYSSSGECFVYKGWAVVTQSENFYEVHIYDGIIDLYKAIENKNLSDLGLEDVNHQKSITTIIESWNSNLPYCYIVADYNGHTFLEADDALNIDYMIPSIKVSWLWNKIFQVFGGVDANYTGSVFLTEAFKNLWMTYPKGVTSEDSSIEAWTGAYAFSVEQNAMRYMVFSSPDTFPLISTNDGVHFTFNQSGFYRVDVVGSLDIGIIAGQDVWFMGKNGAGLSADLVSPYIYVLTNIQNGGSYPINFSTVIQASQDENICFVISDFTGTPNLTLTITKLVDSEFNFTEALSDFSLKDFVTEVVTRFGLTVFKNKYSNTYEFLTLQELLQTSQRVDWSSKLVRKINENYIYGSYAQRNWFRYNYNDKEASHNDWYITVENQNLQDAKDVIKSKIYSPEITPVTLFEEETNVYKLWEKEVNEDDSIKYKPLDKRYYFIRREQINTAIDIKSQQTLETGTNSKYFKERFLKLPFADIIQDYYAPLSKILYKSQIVNVELWLKDTDIVNFDFRKLYYIEQLSSYFIVNKINNYIPGKPTKCELVRVHYATPE